MPIILTLTFAYCVPVQMFALNCTLDTTFNPAGSPPGTVTTTIGAFSDGEGIAIQPDGKIVVVGESVNQAALVRYKTDGTLDTSFNGTGIVTQTIGAFSDLKSVAIQPDGKIVAVGFTFLAGAIQFLVVRYNINGTLDSSFNGTGIKTTAIGSGNNAQANSVAIQPDGKIVVGGVADDAGTTKFALARYNTDGSLDTTTFNSGGSQPGTIITAIGTTAFINGIALQTDGKILATGLVREGGVFKFGTARYNANGTLDTSSFNSGGSMPGVITTAIGTFAESFSVAVQPDGKVVVAGFATIAGVNQFALARYNSDGTIDTTFGIAGIVITAIGTAAQGRGIAVEQNGQLVVAGFATVGGSDQFAVALYNTDGTLDTTFNTVGTPPGTVTTAIGTFAEGKGVALQQDGKIVVGGRATEGGVDKFAAARYCGPIPTPPTPPTPTPPTSIACALRLINKYGSRL